MSKVTSKLQLTVPKVIADEYGIRPGDELEWVPAGDSIRVLPAHRGQAEAALTVDERLNLFDLATERQRKRDAAAVREKGRPDKRSERGWHREDLYKRGLAG